MAMNLTTHTVVSDFKENRGIFDRLAIRLKGLEHGVHKSRGPGVKERKRLNIIIILNVTVFWNYY